MNKKQLFVIPLLFVVTIAFSASLELDNMEYSTDLSAYSTYVGSSTVLLGATSQPSSNASKDYVVFEKFTCTTTGTVTELVIDCNVNSNAKIALYSDSGGEPNSLLVSASGAVVAGYWNRFDVTDVSVTKDTVYWIAYIVSTTGGCTYAASGGVRRYKAETYSTYTFPETYDGTGFTADTIKDTVNASESFLKPYSEAAIIVQGTYSLKCVATTSALNKTLTRTFSTNSNLTGVKNLKFSMYASRTGSNIKIGIYDTGGTTTEITPNIITANTWQTVNFSLASVSDANKDAISKIIITVTNADSANTFYIDYSEIVQAIDVFGDVN